jgi:hypothetical protein
MWLPFPFKFPFSRKENSPMSQKFTDLRDQLAVLSGRITGVVKTNAALSEHSKRQDAQIAELQSQVAALQTSGSVAISEAEADELGAELGQIISTLPEQPVEAPVEVPVEDVAPVEEPAPVEPAPAS